MMYVWAEHLPDRSWICLHLAKKEVDHLSHFELSKFGEPWPTIGGNLARYPQQLALATASAPSRAPVFASDRRLRNVANRLRISLIFMSPRWRWQALTNSSATRG